MDGYSRNNSQNILYDESLLESLLESPTDTLRLLLFDGYSQNILSDIPSDHILGGDRLTASHRSREVCETCLNLILAEALVHCNASASKSDLPLSNQF